MHLRASNGACGLVQSLDLVFSAVERHGRALSGGQWEVVTELMWRQGLEDACVICSGDHSGLGR